MASPLTGCEVPVIPLWSTTVVEKLELVETCNRYDSVRQEELHDNVGLVDMPVERSGGDARAGAAGAANVVLAFQVSPPAGMLPKINWPLQMPPLAVKSAILPEQAVGEEKVPRTVVLYKTPLEVLTGISNAPFCMATCVFALKV